VLNEVLEGDSEEMLKISHAERKFLEEGVAQGIRNDGRGNVDYRHFVLETGILTQTNGSARLRLSNTDVLVGIKLETGEPLPDTPDQGRVQVSVECCPSASPEFEGKGGDALNLELARVLERILNNNSSIDLKKLCILPGKLCWILYADAMVLDSGGNLFDAISIATRAALYNTAVPIVEVDLAHMQFEVVDEGYNKLEIDKVPVCITFTKIGPKYVVDASLEEELCMDVRITFAVNKAGNICTIQKGGQGGVDPKSLDEMLQAAGQMGKQILEKLDIALLLEDSQEPKREKLGFFC